MKSTIAEVTFFNSIRVQLYNYISLELDLMTFIVFYISDQHNFCDQHHALARNKAQTDAGGGSDKVTTGVTNYSKRTLSNHFRRLGDQ